MPAAIGGPHSYDWQPKTKTISAPLKKSIASLSYQYLFRRSTTFMLVGVIGAFAFDWASDAVSDTIFDNVNHGVSTKLKLFQWHLI